MGKLSDFVNKVLAKGTKPPKAAPIEYGPDASRSAEEKAKAEKLEFETERKRGVRGF